jgi:hypothetical protein
MCGYGQDVRRGWSGSHARGCRSSATREAGRVPRVNDERASRVRRPSPLGQDVDRGRAEQARRPLGAVGRLVEQLGEVKPEHPRDPGNLGRAGLVLAAFPCADLRLALTEGSSEGCAVLEDGFAPSSHQVVTKAHGANSCTRFVVRQVGWNWKNHKVSVSGRSPPQKGGFVNLDHVRYLT